MNKRGKSKLNLNKFFLRIVFSGIATFSIIAFILLRQEQNISLEKWQQDTISMSSAHTSSYYTTLVTNVMLNKKESVDEILNTAKKSENLLAIDITAQSKLTRAVLETCNVDYEKAYFNQVPTCLQYANNF